MSNRIHPAKKTLEEMINDLPIDMQEEIIGKLITIKESPKTSPNTNPKISPKNKSIISSIIKKLNTILTLKKTPTHTPKPTIRLSQVNKKFRDEMSYKTRLSKLPMNINSLDELKKTADSVYNIMSNIKLKKIEDQPYNLTGDNIPKNIKQILLRLPGNEYGNALHTPTWEILKHANLEIYETLDEAKNAYTTAHPDKKDFEQRKNEWEDMWNLEHYKYYTLSEIQDSIQKYKDKMLSYDIKNKEKNEKIMNSFMKLNENTTYGKYIDSMKKLPIGVKAIKQGWY